jgi:uncharacterized protein YxjI
MSTALVREAQGVGLATQSHYVIKRKAFAFLERIFRVYTGDGQMFMYVQHPVMKLREEFMVYSDESKSTALLKVKSRQALAINFSYDVEDVVTGKQLGAVEKKGLKSIIRDKFIITDATGAEIGYAEEQGNSVLRRIFKFLTSKHAIFVGDQQVAFVKQNFKWFAKEWEVDLQPSSLDPRFVLAVALLALIADARRQDR